MRYFEDYHLGEVQNAAGVYEVTAEEIIEFGERWDPQPFHIDAEAAEDSIFGGLVASSAHVFAMFVWFSPSFPGERAAVLSALGFSSLRFQVPVRPLDRLTCRATTTGLRLSKSRPNAGIVESHSEVFNQHQALVFTVENAWLVQCRPTAAD